MARSDSQPAGQSPSVSQLPLDEGWRKAGVELFGFAKFSGGQQGVNERIINEILCRQIG